MLTVADGIIRVIVLIAVFIDLFFLMLSGFQESRRLGAKKHHRQARRLALILAMCVVG
jgi:hypothetical protein